MAVAAKPQRGDRTAVAALVFGCLNASLVQTIAFPIQAELPDLLAQPREVTAWVVTATVASASAFAPVSGRLGDIWGRKRVALVLVGLLAVGSLLSGLAPGVGVLIAGRAVQGIAIGLIPLSMSIMKEILPADRLGTALALASATMGVGAAFGIPLGAAMTEWAGWRSIFWVSLALSLVAAAWIAVTVPVAEGRATDRFDLVGAATNIVGSAVLLIGIAEALTLGWDSPVTLALVIGGAACLALGWLAMARNPSPLIDVRVSVRPRILRTNMLSLLINFATMTIMVVFPQLLVLPARSPAGFGLSPVAASLIMMANGVSQAIATPFLARILRRVEPRTVAAAGAAIVTVAITAAIVLTSPQSLLAVNIVVGAAFGVVFAAIPQIIMSAVPAEDAAAANGLNAQIRIFGTAGAATVAGALIAAESIGGVPSASGFALSLGIAAAASGLATLLSMLIPAQRDRHSS
ncbi:MFS transporter [Streptomyces sp. NPDC087787]|uniref:MFS transporter n=1 Tax=Streptomyces sp. NPDC087787 TaxID=3365803 RepID=UPI0038021E7B